jgi:hypothetical protein
VNNTTMPPDNAALSADSQDLCSLGMDRAIGIERASLPTGVRLNSCVIDIYKKASWFVPVGKLFKATAQAIGFCIEMRRSWLSLLAPHALSHVSTGASRSGRQAQPTADELAYSMDIAIKERFTASSSRVATSSGSTVASIVRSQVQPTSDELAYSMDIAIGEQFTAPAPTPEVPEPSRGIAMAATAGG